MNINIAAVVLLLEHVPVRIEVCDTSLLQLFIQLCHTEMSQQIARVLRVAVNLPVEGQRRIPTVPELQNLLSTRMHCDEVVNLMHNSFDHHQYFPVVDARLHFVPVHVRKRLDFLAPVDYSLEFVQLLLLHLEPRLDDLVVGEANQARAEAEVRQKSDHPLRRVVVVPADAVAVVVRELMMVVVVALTLRISRNREEMLEMKFDVRHDAAKQKTKTYKSDKSRDDMVVAGVLLGISLLPKRVRQAVDAEGRLMNEKHATETSVDQRAPEITPSQVADGEGEDKAKEESNGQIVPVLEHNTLVRVEVADVDATSTTGVLLENHPSDVRVPEPLQHAIGILVRVHIPVVGAVIAAPPAGRSLERSGAKPEQHALDGEARVVRFVRVQTVVACGDARAG